MTQRARTYLRVAPLALFLASAAGGYVVTVARAEMKMDEQVAAAKTAADHEALAAEYDRKATEAKAQAEEHRAMAKAYRKAGGAAAKAQLPEHCEGLAR